MLFNRPLEFKSGYSRLWKNKDRKMFLRTAVAGDLVILSDRIHSNGLRPSCDKIPI